MSYIFGKLWHLAIIWAIRKAFQCILQGVRFLLANHTRLSPTSDNDSYIVWLYTLNVVNFTYLCCLNNFPSHRCLWQVINSILLTSLLLPTKELASGFCFREDEVLNQNELHQSLHCSLWISSVSFGFSP